jgi:hypothetical protein
VNCIKSGYLTSPYELLKFCKTEHRGVAVDLNFVLEVPTSNHARAIGSAKDPRGIIQPVETNAEIS